MSEIEQKKSQGLKPLVLKRVMFGCDPEFFIKKDGKTIESEKIITEGGIKGSAGNIVVDGIQAELNPKPSDCREVLANQIAHCFSLLKSNMGKDVKCDFSQSIELSDEEFDNISDKSKKFGCDSSYNINGDDKSRITINQEEYKGRSAGGHIHLGRSSIYNLEIAGAIGSPERLIPLLDIIVGNTCVLLDRDKGNMERRKVYGKAGEYRTPKHGIEYRVLSNFWLKSYPLMSLVMGLCRVAVNIIAYNRRAEQMIRGAVLKVDIEKAINENDFDLAMSNFEKIEPMLLELVETGVCEGMIHPLTKYNIQQFKQFVNDGIDKYFKDDPMTRWCDRVTNSRGEDGWENFVSKIKLKKKRKVYFVKY